MKNKAQSGKKHLFIGEMVQIQEAIYRCRHKMNQLGTAHPNNFLKNKKIFAAWKKGCVKF